MIADLLFCALLIIAAICDIRTRMIENWTILGVLILAVGKLVFNIFIAFTQNLIQEGARGGPESVNSHVGIGYSQCAESVTH